MARFKFHGSLLLAVVKLVYPFTVPVIPSPSLIATAVHVPVAFSLTVGIVMAIPWVVVIGCSVIR